MLQNKGASGSIDVVIVGAPFVFTVAPVEVLPPTDELEVGREHASGDP